MTGEMYQINQNGEDGDGNTWELHAAIAKAIGGQLKPFDQYQGPYIVVGNDLTAGQTPYTMPVQNLGIIRLWVCPQDDVFSFIYREDTDQSSFDFLYNDTEAAIEAAKSLLR